MQRKDRSMAKMIVLDNGFKTLVSDEDYEYLNHCKWFLHSSHKYLCSSSIIHRCGAFMHEIVAIRIGLNVPEKYEIDHINQNTFDNRRENLRVVTKSRNQHNSAIRVDNTSGVKGVSFNAQTGKWIARIQIGGYRETLGSFDTYEQAVEARLQKETKHV